MLIIQYVRKGQLKRLINYLSHSLYRSIRHYTGKCLVLYNFHECILESILLKLIGKSNIQ